MINCYSPQIARRQNALSFATTINLVAFPLTSIRFAQLPRSSDLRSGRLKVLQSDGVRLSKLAKNGNASEPIKKSCLKHKKTRKKWQYVLQILQILMMSHGQSTTGFDGPVPIAPRRHAPRIQLSCHWAQGHRATFLAKWDAARLVQHNCPNAFTTGPKPSTSPTHPTWLEIIKTQNICRNLLCINYMVLYAHETVQKVSSRRWIVQSNVQKQLKHLWDVCRVYDSMIGAKPLEFQSSSMRRTTLSLWKSIKTDPSWSFPR